MLRGLKGRFRLPVLAALWSLLLWAVPPAAAETARVTGGEHSDFTRLVVQAVDSSGWRFGRSDDGYELDLGQAVTGFDVTDAFQKIPRDRITALWREPTTGRLRFSLACACHALAFEFRPGIVVIDIRSGAAPDGSAFEMFLDPHPESGGGAPAEQRDGAGNPAVADAGRYDWLAIARDPVLAATAGGQDLPLPTGEISLDPLRDALLEQISRGAAQGLVEIAEDGPAPENGGNRIGDAPWSRVGLGEMPGVAVGSDRGASGNLTPDGRACLADTALDVGSWGLTGPVSAQIGLARSGMIAEFDAPVPEAILRAARFHIFLGFGAEARQYLALLDEEAPEIRLLQAMARIVDGEPAEDSPFDGMESCASAAALWAILARPDRPLAPGTNAAAVTARFSALPAHLRRHLGGALVDAFMAAGQSDAAHRIRDAMQRVPAEGETELPLMEARFQLAEGNPAGAGVIASDLTAGAGLPSAAAATTLVEAAFQGDHMIDSGLPLALDAYLHMARGTPEEASLLRARILAAAMVTDFATAFDLVDQDPGTFADLWSMAAGQASDDIFLEQAALYALDRPTVAPDVASSVARRLLALGFPDLALHWIGPVRDTDAEETRLIAAQARLALRDAVAALALVQGLDSPAAAALAAEARVQLGETRAAADAMLLAGEVSAAQRALIWTQDWALIGAEGPENWRDAARLATLPEDTPAAGPIARGAVLAEESAAARAVIEDLLGSLAAKPGP